MVLIFDLILALIALAALWQLAKIIFYTCCWLGCQFFWLAIWVLGAIYAVVASGRSPSRHRPRRQSTSFNFRASAPDPVYFYQS